MATAYVYWTGTSGDYMTITYSGSGNGTIQVVSSPNNTGDSRAKTLTVQTTTGKTAVKRTFVVDQPFVPTPTPDPGPTGTPTPTPTGTPTPTPTPRN